MAGRILLVDDDAALVSLLKVVLETRGFTVTTASSAAEATAVLCTSTFELIVTDMGMETQESGYEVVCAAHSQRYHPMVLILTAHPILAQEWRKAGANAMLSKPVSADELLRVVSQLRAARSKGATSRHNVH
jgi:NtrC-family two-component system response regulator AlgB